MLLATHGGVHATAETVAFWIFAVVAVGAAIAMVATRKVVHSALMLVLNFFALAGLYLVLQAPFLAIVQVIVYAGAIMVLFLFVIMLLGLNRDDLLVGVGRWQRVVAWTLGGFVAAAAVAAFATSYTSPASRCGEAAVGRDVDLVPCVGFDAESTSSVTALAERLFTRYTFAFEAASLILIVAVIGAMVLGRRQDLRETPVDASGTPSREVF